MLKKISCLFAVITAYIALTVSCGKQGSAATEYPIAAGTVFPVQHSVEDVVSSFGTLSFDKKLEITVAQEGDIEYLPYKEGAVIKSGTVIARIKNPYIAIGLERAKHTVQQASINLEEAKNRLREGRLQAEVKIESLEKAMLQLELMRKETAEVERKNTTNEQLFSAGGLSLEEIKVSRYELATAREKLAVYEKELAISMIGFRDEDILAAGYEVPADKEARKAVLIQLFTKQLEFAVAQAEQALKTARLDERTSQTAFDELTVRSPCDAIMGVKNKEVGEHVKPGDVLCTIIGTNALYAVLNVSEQDALKLMKGMPADIYIDVLNKTIQGSVDILSPVADARTGSVTVKVLCLKTLPAMKPGMFVRAVVRTGTMKSVMTVPESAVIKTDATHGKVLIAGAKLGDGARLAEARAVVLGSVDASGIEIISGITVDDAVLVNPQTIKEGQSVIIKN